MRGARSALRGTIICMAPIALSRTRQADLPKGKHVMSSVVPAASTAIPAAGRSVQNYIDETPVWADGTSVQSTPMTAMQWWIWMLAAAGKFFEGLVRLHDRRRPAADLGRIR